MVLVIFAMDSMDKVPAKLLVLLQEQIVIATQHLIHFAPEARLVLQLHPRVRLVHQLLAQQMVSHHALVG